MESKIIEINNNKYIVVSNTDHNEYYSYNITKDKFEFLEIKSELDVNILINFKFTEEESKVFSKYLLSLNDDNQKLKLKLGQLV